jgi:cytochrome c-type biogenesis protein
MSDVTSQLSYGIAAVAGLLSFLSPCILPLLPAYLTLITGFSVDRLKDSEAANGGLRRRVMLSSLSFVLGFSTVFVLLGASATLVGQMLSEMHTEIFGIPVGPAQIAGVVIILLGFHLAGWLPIQALYRVWQVDQRRSAVGLASTFAAGAGFAFGWSPCVGPILGTILGVAGSSETVLQGIGLLCAYSAGLAVPFLLSGWSVEFLLRFTDRMRRHFHKIEVGSGLLLIAVGLLFFSGWWAALNDPTSELMSAVTSWVLKVEDALLR